VTVLVSRRDDRQTPYITETGVRVIPLITNWTLWAAIRGELGRLKTALALEDPDVVHLIYPDPYIRYGSDSYHLPFLLKLGGARRLLVTFFGFAVTGASVVTRAGLMGLFAGANRIVITDPGLLHRFRRTFPFWARKASHGFVGTIAGSEAGQWSLSKLGARRADLRLPPEEKLVAFFGFWSADKGLEDLIDAIARLRVEGERMTLVLIGGRDPSFWTDYERTIQSLIVSRGLEDSVIQTGPLSGQSVAAYLLAADICVLPFHVNTLGRSSLAIGLNLGVPLIVSRPPVGDDLLQGVLLVAPKNPQALAEAIREILSDPDKQARVGAASAKASVRWSWSSIADAYIAEYRRLMGTLR
jgi:glycosyltransferase involved in cell wall biosynthesis